MAKSKPQMETILRRRRVPVKKTKGEKRKLKMQRQIVKPKTPSTREKFTRLEEFVKRARDVKKNSRRVKAVRQKLAHKPLVATPAQARTVTLVVRNGASVKNSCRDILTILHVLGLTKQNSAAFVRLDDALLCKLHIVRHFVNWGQPSLKSVKDVFYKHGKLMLEKNQITALSDNRIVEAQFGDKGILCVEDLVDQIHSLGPHFDEIVRKLAPINFSKSKAPHQSIGAHFNPTALKCQPGETKIDALLRSIN